MTDDATGSKKLLASAEYPDPETVEGAFTLPAILLSKRGLKGGGPYEVTSHVSTKLAARLQPAEESEITVFFGCNGPTGGDFNNCRPPTGSSSTHGKCVIDLAS